MPAEYPSEHAFSVEPFSTTDPEEPPVEEEPEQTEEKDEQEAPFFSEDFWKEDDNE